VRRQLTAPLRRIGRWVRRRPILATFLFALVFVVVVPVWPYQPHCGRYGTSTFHTLDGEMTPEFVEAMSISLSEEQVIHVQIGDRIHLTPPISPGYGRSTGAGPG
jgi:hypothetical protein